jgi:putative ABC transport system permease protein
LRFARRDLRAGLQGFWIFLTCLTLGTAAIAIVGSLSAAVERGISEQGQPLLGGDVEFSLTQREATPAELAWLKGRGSLSVIATLRAMAQTEERSTLVEIKAVDSAYPLYGTLAMEGGLPLERALREENGQAGLAADDLLLGRLGLATGGALKLGNASFRVSSTIAAEPDRIADGFMLGPRLLMSHEALRTTGLVQPGSLVTWRYRLKLSGPASLAEARAVADAAKEKFPDAGWRIRTRDQAASGAGNFVERLGYFLTLVGVTALAIGGAGIANAVTAFIHRRTHTIATLKCLGASARDVFAILLTEIMLVSLLGIAAGLLAGAVAPAFVSHFFGSLLPLPVSVGVEWRPLAFAMVLGLLITLAFAIWPLAATGRIAPTALFRQGATAARRLPPWPHMLASILLLGLSTLVILAAFENRKTTGMYLGGLAVSFLALLVLGWLILRLSKHLPRPRQALLRHALSSLNRPGSMALPVILALGLGLTLFVTLGLTDATLTRELKSSLPEKAPAFFFLDVRNEDLPAFEKQLLAQDGVTGVANAPMLRGRIVTVKGIPASEVKVSADAAWALRGDRGLTYSETLPSGSTLVDGEWWAASYSGPPLVSLAEDIAKGLDLRIGDTITVNVLGRDVEATVASFRRVNWRSLGINFVMVFTPNTLKAAPHSHIVTVTMAGGDEARLLNTFAGDWPAVTAIRVKDALDAVSLLLGQMLAAIRAASILALLTGVLVLAGALAAGLSARTYEAVILKTYGASRRQLLLAFAVEYGLLGLFAALFGLIAGTAGSWFLATFIIEVPWVFSLATAVTTALVAMALTVAAGLLATNRALAARPSPYLRNE